MSFRKYECPKCRPMDTEFTVVDQHEIFTTDFDIALFQHAVWTCRITYFILYPTVQIPRTVLTELKTVSFVVARF